MELAKINLKCLNYFLCALKSDDFMLVSTYNITK